MKHYLLLFLLLCNGGCLLAQSSIFDALAKDESGKGKITIRQSREIRQLVGSRFNEEKIVIDGDKSHMLMPGYRIQVFAGNNQRTSKNEAESKEKQIQELFPDTPTYVLYNAPFWRLRVGDYITYEEAHAMQSKLMNAFPNFRKEIQILREEEVKIPLN